MDFAQFVANQMIPEGSEEREMMRAHLMAMASGQMPPGGMPGMPPPPGEEGYDFITGNPDPRFCTAAQVKKLNQTDEWWVVSTGKFDHPLAHDDDDDEEIDEYMSGAAPATSAIDEQD